MTADEALQIVYRRMFDEWDDSTYGTFLLADQAGPPDGPPESWARITFSEVPGGGQRTLGPAPNRRYARPGRVLVQCFGVAELGRKRPVQMAQAARAIFEGVTFSGVRGLDGTTRRAADDPPWLIEIASINVEYDERK